MTAAVPAKVDAPRLTRSTLVHNVIALYGVQIGRKILPLIAIPYLARVLGAVGWGKVAFAAAVSEFVVIVIEFGFNLSATREIARHRDCPQTCGEIMSGVLGAQCLLAIGGVAVALAVAPLIPIMRDNPSLLAGGLVYAVMQGFAPLWFFQGLERLRLSSALEIAGKTAQVCGMFFLVRSPADAWKWMALAATAPTLTTIGAFVLAFRSIPLRRPTVALISSALRMGWPMFVFRSAESLYVVANSFLLGLFAPAEIVGFFASAERVSRAAFGLLNPIRDAIFPRLSHLAKRGGPDAAVSLAKTGAILMITAGLLLGVALFFTAPLTTRILLGGEFAPAIASLRILACLPLLLAITNSLGIQWLIPLGKEAVINRIIISAGLLNVTLALILAPRLQHLGISAAVVSSEFFVCASMLLAVLRTRRVPSTAVALSQG